MGFVLAHQTFGLIFALVFFNLLTSTASENISKIKPEYQNRPRRHLLPPTTVYTYIKHHYRTAKSHQPGILLTKPRILNSGPPVKIVHTGPFYVNHDVYCDSSSHNYGLSTRHPTQEEVSFINNGPTQIHHFDHDVKIGDPSSSHGVDFLNIDFEPNKHLDNFEVNLPSITISDGDKLNNEIVTPLVQGTVHVGEEEFKMDHGFNNAGDFRMPSHEFEVQNHHKYNENLDTIVDYLKENGDANVYGNEKRTNNEQTDKTNHRGEFLNTPKLTKHPLENDHGKSTYDTPGAVDSYGHPVTDTSTPLTDSYDRPISADHSTPLVNSYKKDVHSFGNVEDSFGSNANFGNEKNHNFDSINYNFDNINENFGPSNYLNNFKDSFESFDTNSKFPNDIKHYFQNQFDNSIERLRRSNKGGESTVGPHNKAQSLDNKVESSTVEYSNHKYE